MVDRGSCGHWAIADSGGPLIHHGRQVIERGMAATWIGPAFDEVEESEARVGLGAEAFAIEQLALERREEALTHGVVVGVAHTAHRRADAGLAAAPAEGERRVLAALIRMMNHAGRAA